MLGIIGSSGLGNIQFKKSSSSLLDKSKNSAKSENLDGNSSEDIRLQEWYKDYEESSKKGNIIGNLNNKLNSGAKLTDEELEYLKQNNKELYETAIEVEQEREEYKRELNSAKSKSGISQMHMNKMQKFSRDLSEISKSNMDKSEKLKETDKLGKKFMGVLQEYYEFTSSKKYDELPKESEEDKNNNKIYKFNKNDEENLKYKLGVYNKIEISL